MAKLIPLTQGKFAIVDDLDFDWLSQWKWYAMRAHSINNYYAVRANYSDGKQQRIFMHRAISGMDGWTDTDHANGNGLDNRRENLRSATRSQNICNARRQNNNTSGFKGVSWRSDRGKWRVRVTIDGKRTTLGYFDDLIKAAVAYDVAAIEHYGEFACLNFPVVTNA
jgi:hypothetical protein